MCSDETYIYHSEDSDGKMYSKLRHTQQDDRRVDFYLVLDFEATCMEGRRMSPQEIIEWPVLKVNSRTWETESTFHQYVKPQVHAELTSYCTNLTGITQDMVDNQPHIEEVLKKYDEWMKKEGLLGGKTKFAYVTCGDWDLKTMLPNQCGHFKLPVPEHMKQWINIKKEFVEFTGSVYPKGNDLVIMLDYFKLPLVGRYHSGIDDVANIARILKHMGENGHIFPITGSVK